MRQQTGQTPAQPVLANWAFCFCQQQIILVYSLQADLSTIYISEASVFKTVMIFYCCQFESNEKHSQGFSMICKLLQMLDISEGYLKFSYNSIE